MPKIFNTDQGSQFTSIEFKGLLSALADRANRLEGPVNVPAAPVVVVGFRGNSADVVLNGSPMVFDVYFSKDLKPTKMRPQDLAERYAVTDDPHIKIAAFAPAVQSAVRASKIMLGMT